jgi:transposase InsO family protein
MSDGMGSMIIHRIVHEYTVVLLSIRGSQFRSKSMMVIASDLGRKPSFSVSVMKSGYAVMGF